MSFLCRMRRTTVLSGTVRLYARANRGQHSNNRPPKENAFLRYWRSLKWVPIPLGVGFGYIGYQQFGHVVKREERKLKQPANPEELLAGDWVVTLYRCLPLKIMSRIWGHLNNVELPMWLRPPLYKAYIWAFNCNMEEAVVRDLQHYRCLAQFFRRRLRPGVRPVDQTHAVVCPADGQVLHFGKSEFGLLEQVKGVTYSLQQFLGPPTWPRESVRTEDGELFSVNPSVARLVRGLFNWNERAVYVGHWQSGLFTMGLVGATNVGSIVVYHDKYLETNTPYKYPAGAFFDENFYQKDVGGIPMKKGESFGEFNLGSTIVLVFEAPKNFEFKIEAGQKVKMGEPLGHICI